MVLLSRARRFFGWHGTAGLLRLLFYPVTLLFTTPLRLARTLSNSRAILDRRGDGVIGFSVQRGVNALFYWTMAQNFHRYGRRGHSPHVGLGDYNLSRWFLYTLPSLYAYWRVAALVHVGSLVVWLAAHTVWATRVPPVFVAVVLLLLAISTTAYATFFVLQNYNAIGWAIFPVVLYALMSGQWLMAGAAFLATAFTSTTALFVGGVLAAVTAVELRTLWPLLAFVPAAVKILTHFGDLQSVANLAKAIGLTRRGVRYRREAPKRTFGLIYWPLLCLQFAAVYYWLHRELPLLFVAGLVLQAMNRRFMRFADPQSMVIANASIAAATALASGTWLLLPSLWLVLAPLPGFVGVIDPRHFDRVRVLEPYSVRPLLDAMDRFLAPVQPGERVLMAFSDPDGVYNRIFDGYRVLVEVPSHVATERGFHFMPDWWAVFETNYEGAPSFWGRDAATVSRNVAQWSADYVIVYQEGGTELGAEWTQAGFEPLTKFSWAEHHAEELVTNVIPDWWLLRVAAR